MIEKIRVSLWDLFSFFLSGFLLTAVVLGHLLYLGSISFVQLKDFLFTMPAAQALFVFPLGFTLAGMLLEPIANYFDRWITSPVYELAFKPKQKHKAEELMLAEEIKYLGSLSGKIENPYALCKDYVETKQLSTTFMVFLSRYGFYRNVSFLCIACAVSSAIIATSAGATSKGVVTVVAWTFIAFLFKRRAEDFYSYQAPAVYRAFLIDKLSWVAKDKA